MVSTKWMRFNNSRPFNTASKNFPLTAVCFSSSNIINSISIVINSFAVKQKPIIISLKGVKYVKSKRKSLTGQAAAVERAVELTFP